MIQFANYIYLYNNKKRGKNSEHSDHSFINILFKKLIIIVLFLSLITETRAATLHTHHHRGTTHPLHTLILITLYDRYKHVPKFEDNTLRIILNIERAPPITFDQLQSTTKRYIKSIFIIIILTDVYHVAPMACTAMVLANSVIRR